MAGDTDQSMVQENIEEYVHDENRVVTCKWLSLMLNLNINAAKRALYIFVEHSREKQERNAINTTYFVAGLGKSKTGELEHKCVVVPESELDTVKKSLTVITTCHLYSVQASKLKDYTSLYQTDYDIIKQNLDQCSSHSSIKCSWVSQRVRELTRPDSNNKPNEQSPALSAVSNTTPSSCAAKTTKKAEPKGSIASMFAVCGLKKLGDVPATTKVSDQTAVKSIDNKAKPAPKKGVLSFFNSNGVNKNTLPDNSSKLTVKVEDKQKETVKTKKAEKSDTEPEMKRRRRIRTDLFDSSEDENDEDFEEDQNLEPQVEEQGSPLLFPAEGDDDNDDDDGKDVKKGKEESVKSDEDVENVGAVVNGGGGRKRKRAMKTVLKQFQDEEGFLVTKKEVVWESESDHSEPEEVVEEPRNKVASLPVKQSPTVYKKVEPKGKVATKKQTSPQKGKQTSLTSFFQKR